MSQRPNGSQRGSCSYISALAITAALFAIAAQTASQPGKAAMSDTRASNAQTASTTRLAVEGNMPPLDGATSACTRLSSRSKKNIDNVRRATKEIGVQYPVAVDSDYVIWRAFGNEYWPALYFVDARGRIRHYQFGEGDYEQSETAIKQLLAEAGVSGIGGGLVSVTGKGPEAAADWDNLKSQENYVGYERTENFASPGGTVRDKPRAYATPAHLSLNQWAITGNWTFRKDATRLNDATGQLTYRFHARDLHLVMGPSVPGKHVRFRVLINGHVPGAAHGADVDEQGYGTMSEQRMYQLIRQSKPIGDRDFTITFLDPGAEAFCFTFG